MTKKAALGSPSSAETFLLREKPSFKYCWQQLATWHNFMICMFNTAARVLSCLCLRILWYDLYDQSSGELALEALVSSSPIAMPSALPLLNP